MNAIRMTGLAAAIMVLMSGCVVDPGELLDASATVGAPPEGRRHANEDRRGDDHDREYRDEGRREGGREYDRHDNGRHEGEDRRRERRDEEDD